MRTFQPSPPIAAFYEALIALANQAPQQVSGWGGYAYSYLPISVPAVPAAPTDPVELAFFQTICLPLYNAVVAAAGIGTSIAAPPVQTLADIQAAAAAGDPAAQQAMTEYYFQQASSSAP